MSVRQITDAVKSYVDTKSYDLLVVFYSGHGILKDSLTEQWLLSDAPDYPSESVNLFSSASFARKTGVPHIVFISDACRSQPDNKLILEVTGSSIFPNLQQAPKPSVVDVLWATQPGDPANEVREKDAVGSFRGIYTECLLEALSGTIKTVMQDVSGSNDSIIPCYDLHEYLVTEVPERAAQAKTSLYQQPDANILSRPPQHIARFDKPEENEKLKMGLIKPGDFQLELKSFRNMPVMSKQLGRTDEFDTAFVYNREYLPRLTREDSRWLSDRADLLELEDRLYIEPIQFNSLDRKRASKDIDAYTRPELIGTLANSDRRVKFFHWQNDNILPVLQLDNYLTYVSSKNGVITDMEYYPIHSQGLSDVLNRRQFIRRKQLNDQFRTGDRTVESERYYREASLLKTSGALDPSLTLYLSYLYLQQGELTKLFDVLHHTTRDHVLPDVLLLNEIYHSRKMQFRYRLARFTEQNSFFYPQLTRGWSLLPESKLFQTEHTKVLGKHLVPGLWTTFHKKAFSYIENHLIP